jgi:oligopeptide/dipeptide ABC transporter ATP-binding protein
MASLIQIHNLSSQFLTSKGILKAVDGIDFSIDKGETLGLVGESGCGKSVTSLSILRLLPSPPCKIVSGSIVFKGKDILKLPESELRKIRGNEISMIFQEPMTSLNPVYTVGDQLMEVLKLHLKKNRRESLEIALSFLDIVNIPDPVRRMKEFPHQLSGGMRQRIMIAMALCCNPAFLIADEPTTALDVTIQSKILELLLSLKEKFGLSILFVTHDLGIISQIAQKVIVMYMGKIIEGGDVKKIFENPLHPYTRGLLKSIPFKGKNHEHPNRLKTIGGTLPDPFKMPSGCHFEPRCDNKMKICKEKFPDEYYPEKGHRVRCFLYK